jgi:uncharacterized RDD family membrane protein YckC
MIDPRMDGDARLIEAVHAGEDEVPHEQWAARLVMFLRVMAALALIEGLYHWGIVCGIGAPSPEGFEAYTLPYQSATVFFAVIDLVAAVGLWLAAPWGAVVWLTSIISMTALEALFPQVYGGSIWIILFDLALLAGYLALALLSAREQAR